MTEGLYLHGVDAEKVTDSAARVERTVCRLAKLHGKGDWYYGKHAKQSVCTVVDAVCEQVVTSASRMEAICIRYPISSYPNGNITYIAVVRAPLCGQSLCTGTGEHILQAR